MLYFLRLILVLITVGVLSFVGFFWSLCIPFSPKPLTSIMSLIGQISIKILGIKVKVFGYENLKKANPAIIISNHISMVDILIAAVAGFPSLTVSVGKRDIIKYPIFGLFYYLTGNILINRAKPKDTIRQLNQKMKDVLINKKYYVWMFPEGKRSRGLGLLPFKKGAFKQAIENQTPLVPLIFSNYYKTLNFNKIKAGTVYVQVLSPIITTNMTVEKNLSELVEYSQGLFDKTIKELDEKVKTAN